MIVITRDLFAKKALDWLLDKLLMERRYLIFFIIAFSMVLSACATTPHITYTKKSGVEQLLVAKAVDRALCKENLNLKGGRIFIEVSSLMRKENAYFKKALEHQFLKKGALITEDKKEADLIASLLVKCAGTDGKQFSFGVPTLYVPLINISTPQISIFSGSTQKGYAEIDLILFSLDQGMKEKVGPLIGKSYFNKYTILFIPITSEDIMESEDGGKH
jgi:hypothetical protein